MLERLHIAGFKSFETVSVNLKKLTLLVGENGVGKSSLIQMLLLLRQSLDGIETEELKDLRLHGDLFEAGTALDILNPSAEYTVSISWSEYGQEGGGCFRANRNDQQWLASRRLMAAHPFNAPKLVQGKRFTYLNAERLGPRLASPVSVKPTLAGTIGKFGEYAAAYYSRAFVEESRAVEWAKVVHNDVVRAAMNISAEDVESVGQSHSRIIELFLSKIVPGLGVSSKDLVDVDSAGLTYVRDPLATKIPTRPTHVGFGYSIALPVVLGAFAAWKSALIVENPEAHLHPRSQSMIGQFLSIAAHQCEQVLIETHSDHVLNGVRLAVKLGLISPNEVKILFFELDDGNSKVTEIDVDESGRLSAWPRGFFDQIERDLARL